MRPFLPLILLAAAVPLAAAPAPARKAPATAEWTRTVAATPDGGFRIGNPAAPVRVVTYVSMTCPHCAHADRDLVPPLLANHVRGGRVSFEERPFLLNAPDIAATLVARCGGAAHYFPIAKRLFATQPQWTATLQTAGEDRLRQISALAPGPRLIALADLLGVKAAARARNIPDARLNACLADPQGQEGLVRITQTAVNRFKVDGTPFWLINDAAVEVGDWPALDAAVKAALAKVRK